MGIVVNSKVNQDLRARTGTAFKNNALDTIRTTFELELASTLYVGFATQVVKTGNTFTLTSGSWNNLIAAFNGANIDFRLNAASGTNPTISTTVVSVNGADIVLTSNGGYADGSYSIGFFQITDAPQQFEFFVNLVENSVGTGTASLIDGESQRLSATLVNALVVAGTDNLVQLGNKSGGSQFSIATITREADATSGNKVYTLVVEYKNWMCINNSPYLSAEALGDYYQFNMYMINNDPSVVVSGTHFQTGNTGFENEIFNGNVNDYYTLSSIAWEDDLANPMDAFDYTQPSNFTIVILGNFNALDDLNMKMFTLPNAPTEYSNRANPIENNLMLASGATLIPDATPTNITGNLNDVGAGFDIQNLTFTIVPTSSVTVTGRVVPNAQFTTLFETRGQEDRNYKIWILCEDSTLSYNLSNTVNLVANDTNAKKNIVPLGTWSGMSLEMQAHNLEILSAPIELYLEDDILTTASFTLPKNLLTNPWLSIRGRIVAEKTNGDRFTLEEYYYDTSVLPTDGTTGVLPLNYVEPRGWKLPATSDRHNFSVQLDPTLDTVDVFGVEVLYPFITRYESWLPMPQAANDFFGSTSQNWYNYSSNPNWQLKFELVLETADGEYIDPVEFDIHTYDDWGEVTGSALTYERLDATPVDRPLVDQVVKITATHTIDTEDWTGKQWVVLHARPYHGAPQYLIGSILDYSDLNNPLYPLSGETKGKITLGTKTLILEAYFQPDNMDMTGDVTITTRVSGNTTGGYRGNIYKETYTPAKTPLPPQIRQGFDTTEEDRGYSECCEPFFVLADLVDTRRYKNDVNSVYDYADTMVVTLYKDGVDTGYVIAPRVFPNQLDAQYATIEWRDVAIAHGFGCYSIDVQVTIAGQVYDAYEWGEYELLPYQIDNMYMGEGTARVLSRFNDVNGLTGINMTGSFMLDSIRLRGKAGFNQPNTRIDNVEYQDNEMQKVSREDFESYELRTNLIRLNDVRALRLHLISENDCWLSDHNFDSPDYYFFDKPVIVKEGYVPEYFGGTRSQKGVVIFEDKIRYKKAHFQDNSQTAEAQAPAPVAEPCNPIIIAPVGATVLKTGQTTSFRTGDDGDLEIGRETDWFTLGSNNPFGNTFRFTDELGTQIFANEIVIDWSTYDGAGVNGYRRTISFATYAAIETEYASLNIAGFTGWRIPNVNELFSIAIKSSDYTDLLSYAPFNIANNLNFYTSTLVSTTVTYTFSNGNKSMNTSLISGSNMGIPIKLFTNAELGI